MLGVLQFAQVTQSCYFAAKQVPGDFVVDFEQVYAFDGYFLGWVSIDATQVDITRASFAEQGLVENGVDSVEMSWLLVLHVLSNN